MPRTHPKETLRNKRRRAQRIKTREAYRVVASTTPAPASSATTQQATESSNS